MTSIADTITAIATPQGLGGISIIRISGNDAEHIAKKIFVRKKKDEEEFKNRYLYLGEIFDGDQLVDQAMLVIMRAPYSYTGETVAEFHCHGGWLVANKLLEAILKRGARLADPGEFTKRAFVNGKLDLSQAEAIIDVITAKSDTGLLSANVQRQGALKESVHSLMLGMEDIMAYLEVSIDFTEEGIDALPVNELVERMDRILRRLQELLEEADVGQIIREGVDVVIVGKPNVGKSTLLNVLTGDEKAIVTNIPGTTRDLIEDFIQLKGVLFKLTDTAGYHETGDLVEQIGIEKSERAIAKADIILFVIDDEKDVSGEDFALAKKIAKMDKKTIVALNKIDLKRQYQEERLQKILPDATFLEISAAEGLGIAALQECLVQMAVHGSIGEKQSYLVTKSRHKGALACALTHMQDAKEAAANGLSEEFISIDVKAAWSELGSITGETVDKDILDKIFSEFCIGK